MVRVIFQYSNIFAEGHSFALFYSTFVQIYSNTEEVQQSYSMVAPQLPFFPGNLSFLTPKTWSQMIFPFKTASCPFVSAHWY